MPTSFIIGFGRVNLPHPGHYQYINQCDLFVLSEGEARNKLPASVRYKNLISMYPDLKGKVEVGNIKHYFKKSYSSPLEALVVEDNKRFPPAFGVETKFMDKYGGYSSTMIRKLIDNGEWETLKEVYPTKYQQRLAINIRSQECTKGM